MNRPRKTDVAEDAGLPAARAASEPLQHKSVKPGRRDIAARLLQFISLLVLFVFGLIGTSLHAVRTTGMAHPVLKQHLVSKLGHHPASSPVYTGLMSMNLSVIDGDNSHDNLYAFTKRVAPDLVIVFDSPSTKALEVVASALPEHEAVRGASSIVFYNRNMWRVDEPSILQKTSNLESTAQWIRLQPTIRYHAALRIGTFSPCYPHSDTHAANWLRRMTASVGNDHLLVLVGNSQVIGTEADIFVDPFARLYQEASKDNRILVTRSLRPISAFTFHLPRFPVSGSSVVFEIQSSV